MAGPRSRATDGRPPLWPRTVGEGFHDPATVTLDLFKALENEVNTEHIQRVP